MVLHIVVADDEQDETAVATEGFRAKLKEEVHAALLPETAVAHYYYELFDTWYPLPVVNPQRAVTTGTRSTSTCSENATAD
jgi:hypothetical protein